MLNGPAPFVRWYESRVVIGALVSLGSTLLVLFGLPALGVELQQDLTTAIVAIAVAAGGATSIQGRATVSGGRPLLFRAPRPGDYRGFTILPLAALLMLPLAGCAAAGVAAGGLQKGLDFAEDGCRGYLLRHPEDDGPVALRCTQLLNVKVVIDASGIVHLIPLLAPAPD